MKTVYGMKKRFSYKGYTAIWSDRLHEYQVFTKDEAREPEDSRCSEAELATDVLVREWVDCE